MRTCQLMAPKMAIDKLNLDNIFAYVDELQILETTHWPWWQLQRIYEAHLNLDFFLKS